MNLGFVVLVVFEEMFENSQNMMIAQGQWSNNGLGLFYSQIFKYTLRQLLFP